MKNLLQTHFNNVGGESIKTNKRSNSSNKKSLDNMKYEISNELGIRSSNVKSNKKGKSNSCKRKMDMKNCKKK